MFLQPPNPSSFVWFSLISSRRGGRTAVALTLDTAVDESRKMPDRVTKGPPLDLVAETGSFVATDAMNTILLLFCLASLFSSFSPSLSRYVPLLRVSPSVQQPSAPL